VQTAALQVKSILNTAGTGYKASVKHDSETIDSAAEIDSIPSFDIMLLHGCPQQLRHSERHV